MENINSEILEVTDNAVKIQEVRTYVMTAEQIKLELNNIDFRKRDLINQSKNIKSQFDTVVARENDLKSALKSIEKDVVIPDTLETIE